MQSVNYVNAATVEFSGEGSVLLCGRTPGAGRTYCDGIDYHRDIVQSQILIAQQKLIYRSSFSSTKDLTYQGAPFNAGSRLNIRLRILCRIPEQ